MSFKRNIENYLNSWKLSNNRKPLIIRGARQVGKTTLIRNFAKTYQYSIVLNLEKVNDLRYFEDFEDVQTILEALFLAHTIPSSAISNTLLFIEKTQRLYFKHQ